MTGTEEAREAWRQHCIDMAEGRKPATTSAAFDAGVRAGIRLARASVEHELSAIHPDSPITRDGALTSALAAIDALEADHD